MPETPREKARRELRQIDAALAAAQAKIPSLRAGLAELLEALDGKEKEGES